MPQTAIDQYYASVGLTRDRQQGLVVVNFETDNSAGGEQAQIGNAHDSTLIIDGQGDLVAGDTIPPNSEDRTIIFPNTASGETTITVTAPAGYHCNLWPPVARWPVKANTGTGIGVECAAE